MAGKSSRRSVIAQFQNGDSEGKKGGKKSSPPTLKGTGRAASPSSESESEGATLGVGFQAPAKKPRRRAKKAAAAKKTEAKAAEAKAAEAKAAAPAPAPATRGPDAMGQVASAANFVAKAAAGIFGKNAPEKPAPAKSAPAAARVKSPAPGPAPRAAAPAAPKGGAVFFTLRTEELTNPAALERAQRTPVLARAPAAAAETARAGPAAHAPSAAGPVFFALRMEELTDAGALARAQRQASLSRPAAAPAPKAAKAPAKAAAPAPKAAKTPAKAAAPAAKAAAPAAKASAPATKATKAAAPAAEVAPKGAVGADAPADLEKTWADFDEPTSGYTPDTPPGAATVRCESYPHASGAWQAPRGGVDPLASWSEEFPPYDYTAQAFCVTAGGAGPAAAAPPAAGAPPAPGPAAAPAPAAAAPPASSADAFPALPATPNAEAILLQAFGWDSWRQGGEAGWWAALEARVPELEAFGITHAWLPPPSQSVSAEGYLPGQLYNLDSRYGSLGQLQSLNRALRARGIHPVCDIVVNHRCADGQDENGVWNQYGDDVDHQGNRIDWGRWAITGDDPDFGGEGNPDTGDDYGAAPDLDHLNPDLRAALVAWMSWLQRDVGFDGWRFDFARGFGPEFVREYVSETTGPLRFNVGEFWVDLAWQGSDLEHNQDAARQRICDWIDGTAGHAGAFDFVTKGILQEAVKHTEYWRLRDRKGKAAGLIGWWPGRAVTFVDNHDTGSTQRHWPFPDDGLGLGYAYILTHPGVPCLFLEHVLGDPDLARTLVSLVEARRGAGILADSPLEILCAESDLYVARVRGETHSLVLKMGPRWDMGDLYQDRWTQVASGKDFCVWSEPR